jgi:outer membrane receptor protein involved in Fe transport
LGSPCTDLDTQTSDSGETHKLNLTYQITDDKMVYATYSTGFRPGGVNRRDDLPGIGPYGPDTLDNYEFGWKTQWADGHIRLNGDVYYEKWNSFQFPYLGPNSVTIIANVGQADVKGAELDASWLPIDGLTLNASAAYNDAKLGAGTVAPKGTQLPITPMWKLNAIARYEFNFADFNAHVQGAMVHQSHTWPDLRIYQRDLLGKTEPFTTFDFTTGIGRDSWMLELSVQNLFDERAQLGRYPDCTPEVCGFETYILPTQPRTIGLTWTQDFD